MSETSSSDLKINYPMANDNIIDDNKKPLTTDTDYYFGMMANPNKIIIQQDASESSEINNIKSSESSSKSMSKSSSKSKYSNSSKSIEHINIPKSSNNTNYFNEPKFNTNNESKFNTNNESKTETIKMTPQEIRLKKIELLRRLSELKSKGYQLSKEYDFESSLEEMEYEFDLIKSFAGKRQGVKGFKTFLLQGISVVEYLNDKYDPFDFHLSGWNEHVQVEIDSWEDTLEDLYEKYKGSGKDISPEIKLLFLIGISAGSFHMAKSHGAKSILQTGITNKLLNNKKESSQFMTEQEIHIEKLREEFKKKDLEQKQQLDQIQKQLKTQELNNGPMPSNYIKPVSADSLRESKINNNENVQDILNRYRNLRPNNTDTQEDTTSNNDRLISESNISESNPKRKYNKKKSNISVM